MCRSVGSVAAIVVLIGNGVARAEAPASPDAAPELKAAVPPYFVSHEAADSHVTVRAPKDWREVTGLRATTKLALATDAGPSAKLTVTPSGGLPLDQVPTVVPARLAKAFTDFKLEKADFVKLSGQPAARLVYTATVAGLPLKFCQLLVIKNNLSYCLTYMGEPDTYDGRLSEFESIAVSMKLP